jgi:hypothetical protein
VGRPVGESLKKETHLEHERFSIEKITFAIVAARDYIRRHIYNYEQ